MPTIFAQKAVLDYPVEHNTGSQWLDYRFGVFYVRVFLAQSFGFSFHYQRRLNTNGGRLFSG